MKTDTLDITSQAVADKAECKLNNAKGEPMRSAGSQRCSITMFGPASEKFAELQVLQSKRTVEMVRSRGEGDVTVEENARLTAEDLAFVTEKFNNFTYPHPEGGQWASDREMFVACYMDPKIGFVRDQANAFFGRWGNFYGGSPTN